MTIVEAGYLLILQGKECLVRKLSTASSRLVLFPSVSFLAALFTYFYYYHHNYSLITIPRPCRWPL